MGVKEKFERFDAFMRMNKENLDERVGRCLQNGNMERVDTLKKCYGWTFTDQGAVAHNIVGLGCMLLGKGEREEFLSLMEQMKWDTHSQKIVNKVTCLGKNIAIFHIDPKELTASIDKCMKACSEGEIPAIQIPAIKNAYFNAKYLRMMLTLLGDERQIDISCADYEWPEQSVKEYKCADVPLFIFSNDDKEVEALYYLAAISLTELDSASYHVEKFVPKDDAKDDDDPLSFFF